MREELRIQDENLAYNLSLTKSDNKAKNAVPVLIYFWRSHMSEKLTDEGLEHTLTLEVKKKLLVVFNKNCSDAQTFDLNENVQDSLLEEDSEDKCSDKIYEKHEEKEEKDLKQKTLFYTTPEDEADYVKETASEETNGTMLK